MKKVLYIQCAVLSALWLSTGCSTSRTASYSTPRGTTAMAYSYPNGGTGGAITAGQGSTTSAESSMQDNTASSGANATTDVANRSDIANGGAERIENANQADIPLRKEELVVGKREVSNGSVLVRKVVQTENVSQPVQLRREEYVVERIPANDIRNQNYNQNAVDRAFQPEEIFIPLLREEPVVGKRAVLTENVRIGKRIDTEHQTVTRPVRVETIDIVKNPNNMGNMGAQASANINDQSLAANTATANPAIMNNANGAESLSLAREELLVGKREVSNGGVLLRKQVQTQEASQPIDLRREEFTIDRTPANNQLVNNADFSNQEIRIDLRREEPVVSTRNYVTEIVHVRKNVATDTQTVSGTVRHEDVQVVQNGTTVNGNTTQSGINNNQFLNGQGGTGSALQSGSSSMSESSNANAINRPAASTDINVNAGTRHPIPPPKAGEVLEFHDFSGQPVDHRP